MRRLFKTSKKALAVALAVVMAMPSLSMAANVSAETSTGNVQVSRPLYNFDFEGNNPLANKGTVTGAVATVHGAGSVADGVFNNAVGGAETTRTNYLSLPVDMLKNVADTGNEEITIRFKIKGDSSSTYNIYSPLFTISKEVTPGTENAWPCFAVYQRGGVYVNSWGVIDASENFGVAAVPTYMTDQQWHVITVVATADNIKYYVDDTLHQDTDSMVAGKLFSNSDYETVDALLVAKNLLDSTQVCLGGNQLFTWGDPDVAAYFDDFQVYAEALTEEQMAAIDAGTAEFVDYTIGTTAVTKPVFDYDFEGNTPLANKGTAGSADAVIVGTGSVNNGMFNNGVGSAAATRGNYLQLPETMLDTIRELGTNELTIAFKVKGDSSVSYSKWSPLFTMSTPVTPGTENTWPCFAVYERGGAYVNSWGVIEASQNAPAADAGSVPYYMTDDQWHSIIVTATATGLRYYLDGELLQYACSDVGNKFFTVADPEGTETTSLADDATQVCLGGNQLFTWADPDVAAYFDDFEVYAEAFNNTQVKAYVEGNTVEVELDTIGAQTDNSEDKLGFVTTVNKDVFTALQSTIVEMGVLVKNSDNATSDAMVLENVGAAIKKIPTSYVTDINNLDSNIQDSEIYAFRSIITDIQNKDKEYTAVPYVVFADGNVIYGTEITRTIEEVN